ncbi:MAG: glutamate racemase [Myxococcota bacterium]
MKGNQAIGVFDSGVGGLTVLRALHARLPKEGTIYLGDTARVPYGTKSPETITRYALEIGRFLRSHDVKAIVVACSTASSVALDALRAEHDVPILGVVEAGANKALTVTRGGSVAVAATEATVRSGAYARMMSRRRADVKVVQRACPLFVPLAEEGTVEGPLARAVVAHHLLDLKDSDVDTLLMGCTHYPLLRHAISEVLGERITIVDGADAVADELAALLSERGLLGTLETPLRRYYASDDPRRMQVLGSRFLGSTVERVEGVEL